jgi:hypothetical protein
VMAGTHPDELDLFAYVEGDLGGRERDSVARHLPTCADCGSRIRELEHARDVLRAAPALELPADRATLELPRRTDERRVYVSPMRLATVLAPVAAVVTLIVAVASLTSGGDDAGESAGGGGDAAMEAQPPGGTEETDEAGGAEAASAPSTVLVRRVQGPPEEVAAALRSRGLDADVVDNKVVVRDAEPRVVRRALASRPRGSVRVLRAGG